MRPLPLILLVACDPYAAWPSPTDAFPWVVSEEPDVEPWELVRVETETWQPGVDLNPTGAYIRKSLEHKRSGPPEILDHFDAHRSSMPTAAHGGLTLAFVGDVLWVGSNWEHVFDAAPQMDDASLRVGNLEVPTSPDHPTELGALGLYALNAPPTLLDGLPLDLVQLNNNHSLDAGADGLLATVGELTERGIASTGCGTHTVRDVDGIPVGFASYTWGLNERDVTAPHDLFVVPFGHLDAEPDLAGIRRDLRALAEEGAQVRVALVHWGFEYEYYPHERFLQLGRQLVMLGADVVVGTGPHVVQPAERCDVNRPEVVPGVGTCSVRREESGSRTAVILHSLGNFGATPTLASPQTSGGIVARVSLDPDEGVTAVSWQAVAMDRSGDAPRVVPLDTLDDPSSLEEAERLAQHLGAGWRR